MAGPKPDFCPFCGNPKTKLRRQRRPRLKTLTGSCVECGICQSWIERPAETPARIVEASRAAIAAWNRRDGQETPGPGPCCVCCGSQEPPGVVFTTITKPIIRQPDQQPYLKYKPRRKPRLIWVCRLRCRDCDLTATGLSIEPHGESVQMRRLCPDETWARRAAPPGPDWMRPEMAAFDVRRKRAYREWKERIDKREKLFAEFCRMAIKMEAIGERPPGFAMHVRALTEAWRRTGAGPYGYPSIYIDFSK